MNYRKLLVPMDCIGTPSGRTMQHEITNHRILRIRFDLTITRVVLLGNKREREWESEWGREREREEVPFNTSNSWRRLCSSAKWVQIFRVPPLTLGKYERMEKVIPETNLQSDLVQSCANSNPSHLSCAREMHYLWSQFLRTRNTHHIAKCSSS